MAKRVKIPGRLESAETGNIVTGADAVMDDARGKTQVVINSEVDAAIISLAQGKQDALTFDSAPTEGSPNPVTSAGVYTADKVLSDAIEAILLLIPSAASALNKLVDMQTMNSSIATATASFKGTYNLVSDLHLGVDATHEQIGAALDALSLDADNNDYAFVQVPNSATAPTEIRVTERYKFNGTNWLFEYDLNNSGFTSPQWNAINSGVTSLLVGKLSHLPTNAELTTLLAGKQDNLTFDNMPTAGSPNPVKSGGVYARNNEIVALINALDAAKQDVLTFDNAPVDGSPNPVKSGGVYTAISAVQAAIVALDAEKQNVLTFDSTPTLGSPNPVTSSGIKTELNRIDGNITTLNDLYEALTQSALVVVQPTDTWPVVSPATKTIYRVVDRANTPPQYYSDYMWNGTAMVLMAEYDNAIDDEPMAGSNNLVKSGGVYEFVKKGLIFDSNSFKNGYYSEDGYHNVSWAITMKIATSILPGAYRIKINSGYNCYIVASDNYNESSAFRRIRSIENLNNDEIVNGQITEEINDKYVWITITKTDFTSINPSEIEVAGLQIVKENDNVRQAGISNNVILVNGTIRNSIEGYKGVLVECEPDTDYSFLTVIVESVAFFSSKSPYNGTMISFNEVNSNHIHTPSDCICFLANIHIENPAVNQLGGSVPYIKGSAKVLTNENILQYSTFKRGEMTVDGYTDVQGVRCLQNPVIIHENKKYIISINAGYYVYFVGKHKMSDTFYSRILSDKGNEYFAEGDVLETDCKFVWATVKTVDFPTTQMSYNDIISCGIKVVMAEESVSLKYRSFGRKGMKVFDGSHDWVEVYSENGSGILENMFFAGNFPTARRTEVQVVCDGEICLEGFVIELAGVPAELSIDVSNIVFGNEYFGKTGKNNGIYLNFKIPYYQNISIKFRNISYTGNPYYWFSCRTVDWHNLIIGNINIPYGAKFKCTAKVAVNVASGNQITLLSKEKGKNALIFGTILFAVGNSSMWYLEGMLRDYINDEQDPLIISTGLEDYFLGTYYFENGTYHLPIAGCNYIDVNNNEIAAYRLHYNDNWTLDDNKHVITLRNNDLNTEDASEIQNPTTATYRIYFMHYIW